MPPPAKMGNAVYYILGAAFAAAGVGLLVAHFVGDIELWPSLMFFGLVVLVGVIAPISEYFIRRARPGRALAWARAPLGQNVTLSFVAEPTRYHGLWVNFDIDWELRERPHGFVFDVELWSNGQLSLRDRFYQSFAIPHIPGKPVSSLKIQVGVSGSSRAPEGLTSCRRVVDRNLYSRREAQGWRGELRQFTCFAELQLPPGQHVDLRGVIRPTAPDARLYRFDAEVFVAVAP